MNSIDIQPIEVIPITPPVKLVKNLTKISIKE